MEKKRTLFRGSKPIDSTYFLNQNQRPRLVNQNILSQKAKNKQD